MPIEYRTGGKELLSEIKDTWYLLNKYHTNVSKYFKNRFENFSFEDRLKILKEKSKKGELLVLLPYSDNVKIGHCVSSIVEDKGVIETIYVKKSYRNKGIGKIMLNKSINWLQSKNPKEISIKVVYGNSKARELYENLGFKPSSIKLKLIEDL